MDVFPFQLLDLFGGLMATAIKHGCQICLCVLARTVEALAQHRGDAVLVGIVRCPELPAVALIYGDVLV